LNSPDNKNWVSGTNEFSKSRTSIGRRQANEKILRKALKCNDDAYQRASHTRWTNPDAATMARCQVSTAKVIRTMAAMNFRFKWLVWHFVVSGART
jgi:hypothetical protein